MRLENVSWKAQANENGGGDDETPGIFLRVVCRELAGAHWSASTTRACGGLMAGLTSIRKHGRTRRGATNRENHANSTDHTKKGSDEVGAVLGHSAARRSCQIPRGLRGNFGPRRIGSGSVRASWKRATAAWAPAAERWAPFPLAGAACDKEIHSEWNYIWFRFAERE